MNANRVQLWTASLLLLGVTAIWGGTFGPMQAAIRDIPFLSLLAIRFAVAAIAMALMLPRLLVRTNRKVLLAGLASGTALCSGYAFQTAGLQWTTQSNSGFITGLSVVIVPLIAALLYRYRPSWSVLGGICSATAGLALLTLGSPRGLGAGDLLTLGCAVAFAVQILIVERYTGQVEPFLLTLYQLFTVAVGCIILALLFEPPLTAGNFTTPVWYALALTAIPASSLAFLIQSWAQRFISSTQTAIIFSAEPAFAALFAVVFPPYERLTLWAILGCILILFGMLSTSKDSRR